MDVICLNVTNKTSKLTTTTASTLSLTPLFDVWVPTTESSILAEEPEMIETPFDTPFDASFKKITSLSIADIDNMTEQIQEYLSRHSTEFNHTIEVYFMVTIACLGLVFNCLAQAAIVWDRRSSTPSRLLQFIYISLEQIFLILICIFVYLRWNFNPVKILEELNYFTAVLGIVQFVQPWMLYLLLEHANQHLEILRGRLAAPRATPLILIFIFSTTIGGVYFSLYFPPVRVFVYNLFPHTLCNIPIENYWDLYDFRKEFKVIRGDVFYIVFYVWMFLLSVYLLPFLAMCYRNKRVIDSIHRLQENRPLSIPEEDIIFSSLSASVACTSHLICISTKLAIMLFYSAEAITLFVRNGKVFIQYLNDIANLMTVVRASIYLPLYCRYNANINLIAKLVSFRFKCLLDRLFNRWQIYKSMRNAILRISQK